MPVAFEQAGVLQRFATDYYSYGLAGGLARALPSSLAKRARSRMTPDLPTNKVFSFPVFALCSGLEARLKPSPSRQSRRWISTGKTFASLCRRHLDRQTTHVYAFTSAAKELFEAATASGVRCILDHATAPRKNEMGLVSAENDRFPEWALGDERDGHLDAYHERQMAEARYADTVICNSTFAKRTLLEEGLDARKIVVVPLGIRLPVGQTPDTRVQRVRGKLRILYVGAEALRKGAPYLVDAIRQLGPGSLDTRFVGHLGLSPHGLRQVQRVGQAFGDVPRDEMEAHFQWADVLVLPSVSDTFGLVILEAMSRGVPVIASDHTGGPDVIRDQIDGFVVPARDSNAIAVALNELASRPDRLEEMSRNASIRAAAFSLDAYRARLVRATQGPETSGEALHS